MKVEVGEWVRTKKGIIYKATQGLNNNIPKKYNKLVDPIGKY